MKPDPWYKRHPVATRLIVLACVLPFGVGGVIAADAIFRSKISTWSLTGAQIGLSLGGDMIGAALGIAIVMAIGDISARRTR